MDKATSSGLQGSEEGPVTHGRTAVIRGSSGPAPSRARSPDLVYLDQLQAAGLELFEMDCQHCPRRGRYRIARLIERFGVDVLILDALSADCPRRTASPNPYHRCGARSVTFRNFNAAPPRR